MPRVSAAGLDENPKAFHGFSLFFISLHKPSIAVISCIVQVVPEAAFIFSNMFYGLEEMAAIFIGQSLGRLNKIRGIGRTQHFIAFMWGDADHSSISSVSLRVLGSNTLILVGDADKAALSFVSQPE